MPIQKPVSTLIFDWGDTLMRDFDLPGPMSQWPAVEYIEGVEEVLQFLYPKYTCVVATSAAHSDTTEMIAALKRVGADRYFHHFFSSREIGYYKPDPQFFSTIVKKLDLAPEKCVMIGNLYAKDIVGAKKAGLQTILFDEQKQALDFADADMVIHKISDLIPIL